MGFERLKSLSEKTLVPIGVSVFTLWVGWWWRDREAMKDDQAKVSLSQQMRLEVAGATAAIIAQIELQSERFVMLDKNRGEQVDQSFLALFELNATLTRPYRYK